MDTDVFNIPNAWRVMEGSHRHPHACFFPLEHALKISLTLCAGIKIMYPLLLHSRLSSSSSHTVHIYHTGKIETSSHWIQLVSKSRMQCCCHDTHKDSLWSSFFTSKHKFTEVSQTSWKHLSSRCFSFFFFKSCLILILWATLLLSHLVCPNASVPLSWKHSSVALLIVKNITGYLFL